MNYYRNFCILLFLNIFVLGTDAFANPTSDENLNKSNDSINYIYSGNSKTGRIAGKVVKSDKTMPISGVIIKAMGPYDFEIESATSTITDSEGNYSIVLPTGNYFIRGIKNEYIGYISTECKTVYIDSTNILNFSLIKTVFDGQKLSQKEKNDIANTLYVQGIFEYVFGRLTEALHLWEKCLEYNPEYKKAKVGIQKVKSKKRNKL